MKSISEDFYVVAYEPGAENQSLPAWANHNVNPAELADDYPHGNITRCELSEVPGAYQLLNVLSRDECRRMIDLSERLGYLNDAAVSLPREIRHNDNVVWVTDEQTDNIIWQRVAPLVSQNLALFDGKKPVGLNARFRFYRYHCDDFFKFHSDGAWPGSRVIDGELIANAYPDRYSWMTFLILLNDDFEGGATRFIVDANAPFDSDRQGSATKAVDIRTPAGGVLCFPHGSHPLHCVHSGERITRGTKYIIRTDVLFEI